MRNYGVAALMILLATINGMAQQKISIKDNVESLEPTVTVDGMEEEVGKLDTSHDIILSCDPTLDNANIRFILTGEDPGDYSGQIQNNRIIGINTQPVLNLTVRADGYNDLVIAGIGASSESFEDNNRDANVRDESSSGKGYKKEVTAQQYLLNHYECSDLNFHDLRALLQSNRRYDSRRDEAYLILDDRGRLIGNMPVNLDQDDRVFIYIVVNEIESDLYDVEVVGGEYAPVDLQIRSYDLPSNIMETQSKIPGSWKVIRFERGPYTSDMVTFNIKKGIDDDVEVLSTYSLRINKLYHVAIGVSFISTELPYPDYDVFPLTDSTNTIRKINDSHRTMVTVNVIWYWWSTLKYFFPSNPLTRGRDIMKEPKFYERINPTFGVSLDKEYDENFFFGVNIEFARGGSVTFGTHYGKFKKLAYEEFVLGESVFRGSKENIILTDRWHSKPFIGITLDTRILSKIIPNI